MLNALNHYEYSLIILNQPVQDKTLICTKILTETLHLAAKKDDTLSKYQTITFQELNGTNILQLSNTGHWANICKEKLPSSLLLVQEDPKAYQLLTETSSLPTFRTNLTIPRFQNREDRTYIPITDKEATLSFYLVYPKKEKDKFDFLKHEVLSIPWENYREKDFEKG